MVIRVGHPEKWIDYSSIEICRDDYLGNVMRLNQFDITRNLAKLKNQSSMMSFPFPTQPCLLRSMLPTNSRQQD